MVARQAAAQQRPSRRSQSRKECALQPLSLVLQAGSFTRTCFFVAKLPHLLSTIGAPPSPSRPRFSRKTSNRGHLVGKWARICKIFLFGAGLSSVNPRSPDVCSARPGLLQISNNLDSTIWTESTPRSTPNGNILRIRAEKTTTCQQETQKGRPSQRTTRREPKRAANSRHTDPQRGARRQRSSRTSTLWISRAGL